MKRGIYWKGNFEKYQFFNRAHSDTFFFGSLVLRDSLDCASTNR